MPPPKSAGSSCGTSMSWLPARPRCAFARPHACERLEAAALRRNREDFVQHLARSLHISRAQARRIARDDLGEPSWSRPKHSTCPRHALSDPAVPQSDGRPFGRARARAGRAVRRDHVAGGRAHARDMAGAAPTDARSGVHQPQLWNDETRAAPRACRRQRRSPRHRRPSGPAQRIVSASGLRRQYRRENSGRRVFDLDDPHIGVEFDLARQIGLDLGICDRLRGEARSEGAIGRPRSSNALCGAGPNKSDVPSSRQMRMKTAPASSAPRRRTTRERALDLHRRR